jgi:hypothetical protein
MANQPPHAQEVHGKLVTVQLPNYRSCPKADLRYTIFNDSSIFSAIPMGMIITEEIYASSETPVVQPPDPEVGESIVTDLQAAVDQLSLTSPFCPFRRAARPYGMVTSLAPPPYAEFRSDPALEEDAAFLEINERLNGVKSLF